MRQNHPSEHLSGNQEAHELVGGKFFQKDKPREQRQHNGDGAVRPQPAVAHNCEHALFFPAASGHCLEEYRRFYPVVYDAAHNAHEAFIANMDETTAHEIAVAAERDGSFVVTNARNGFSKSYAK